MMKNSIPKVKTAEVLLVNVDDRQTALLRMAFKMYNSVNYQLIQHEENAKPELILVDGDSKDGETVWQQTKEKYPNAVVVFFARQTPSITAPYLMKPIKFDTLFQHLRNLQQGNGVWLPENYDDPEPAVNKTEQPAQTDKPADDKPTDDKPTEQSIKIERFQTKRTLLGLVQSLSQQKNDTAIMVDDKPVLIVFPDKSKVLLVVESDVLQKLCLRDDVEWKTRVLPASASTAKLHEKAKLKLQACIWQISIWTSRGRLIDPITPNTIIKLKAWPNMTRLAFLPEGIRLSAFLVRSPVALNTLYKLLPVSLEDVLNYIAATYSIGALEIEQPLTHSAPEQEQEMILTRKASPSPEPTEEDGTESAEDTDGEAAKPKGLLARLMGRLRGN